MELNLRSLSYTLKTGTGTVTVQKEITHNLHYQLTPCIRDLLEKLTVPQVVKTFASFYGTRSFMTVFETACHMSTTAAR